MDNLMDELKRLHQSAEVGFSPWNSWENLKNAANINGLVATIERSGADRFGPQYIITYKNKSGVKMPIATEMHNNGMAVTSVRGERVPGTGLTTEPIWQSEALSNAVWLLRGKKHLFNMREHGIFCDGYKDCNGMDVADVFAYLLKGRLFGVPAKDMSKEDIGLLISQFSSEELNTLSQALESGTREDVLISDQEEAKSLLARVDACGFEDRFIKQVGMRP